MVLAAAKLRWRSPNFYGNGRQGQKQNGVDVWGEPALGSRIGLQCKNAVRSSLSLDIVNNEVANAGEFTPALTEIYVATTAPRDATLQAAVRQLSFSREQQGLFKVAVLFWEDISGDLASDQQVFATHYPQFVPTAPSPPTDDQVRLGAFLNHYGTLVTYLFHAGGEIAFSIDEPRFAELTELSWPDWKFESLEPHVSKLQQDLMSGLIAVYNNYNAGSYDDIGRSIRWRQEQPNQAEELNRRRKQLDRLIQEIWATFLRLKNLRSKGS
ncbi:hypothetical protein [Variovorax sp. YR566]|uniref:hypothetical protein n=1 Tax=Variovorax sp. YR566 TaxID=3450237 RepID=UPI003F7F56F6